jgi:hypothetical protein
MIEKSNLKSLSGLQGHRVIIDADLNADLGKLFVVCVCNATGASCEQMKNIDKMGHVPVLYFKQCLGHGDHFFGFQNKCDGK